MSSVVISGDTSGAITLAAPAVAGTNTITLPASTGTAMVNGPAFSAYANANQTITSSTFTKIQINTEEFDTANAFDSTTNYRFTPQVAGYYQINGSVNNYSSTLPTRVFAVIYKNGAVYKRFNDNSVNTGTLFSNSEGSALVYLNGSTDYVELYGFITATTAVVSTDSSYVYFQATMVRGA